MSRPPKIWQTIVQALHIAGTILGGLLMGAAIGWLLTILWPQLTFWGWLGGLLFGLSIGSWRANIEAQKKDKDA